MDDRYRIEALIDQGGTGAVYKGFDTRLERAVAIKRLVQPGEGSSLDVPSTETATGSTSPGSPASLWREAKVLSSLKHPNIVTIFDFGTDEEGPFVIMEFIEGETLSATVRRAPLTEIDFQIVARDTLEALVAAHAREVTHRDIKPSNVMLEWMPTGTFRAKLLDFGLAKVAGAPSLQTMDQGGGIFGSIFYMAPEQFERQPLDERTDLYALGASYYFALTSRHPFNGETGAEVMAAHLAHQFTPLQELRPDLPSPLCDWIHALIARSPVDRPSSAARALCDFNLLGSAPPVPNAVHAESSQIAVHMPSGDPDHLTGKSRPASWGPVIAALVAGLVLVATGGAFVAHQRGVQLPEFVQNAAEKAGIASPSALGEPAGTETTPPDSLLPASSPPPDPADPPDEVPPPEVAPLVDPLPAPAPAPVVDVLPVFSPFDVEALDRHLDQPVAIEGLIVRAGESKSGKTRYLNFSRRPGESIAIGFRVENVGRLYSMDRLRSFESKQVRVEGTPIRLFGDLLIFVQNEDQLTELP